MKQPCSYTRSSKHTTENHSDLKKIICCHIFSLKKSFKLLQFFFHFLFHSNFLTWYQTNICCMNLISFAFSLLKHRIFRSVVFLKASLTTFFGRIFGKRCLSFDIILQNSIPLLIFQARNNCFENHLKF